MKVNDTVLILSTDSDFLENYIGTHGTVTRISGNVYVQCIGGLCDGLWAFDEKDLEVVEQ